MLLNLFLHIIIYIFCVQRCFHPLVLSCLKMLMITSAFLSFIIFYFSFLWEFKYFALVSFLMYFTSTLILYICVGLLLIRHINSCHFYFYCLNSFTILQYTVMKHCFFNSLFLSTLQLFLNYLYFAFLPPIAQSIICHIIEVGGLLRLGWNILLLA